jgi:hypothetical protein
MKSREQELGREINHDYIGNKNLVHETIHDYNKEKKM